MQRSRECGQGKVNYDDETQTFVCVCSKRGCYWSVHNDKGDIVSSGENKPRVGVGDPKPGITVDGKREVIAKALGERWKRPVSAAPGTARDTRMRKAAAGTREEIARALGLKLG